MAITRNEFATKAIAEYLGVDKIYTFLDPIKLEHQYICMVNGHVALEMLFDDYTSLEDRLTAMKVALRMEHGDNSKTEGSSPS